MAITRADAITQTSKQRELFSDFATSFAPVPMSGELARVTNERAVKQAMYNLVMTDLNERPFQPNLGCGVRQSLFEPAGPIVYESLRLRIESTLRNHEPRANILGVRVKPVPNDSNSIEVVIAFTLMNSTERLETRILLKVVR